ncbi:AMP-binding protein [Alphaproteobacteria bacterium]|nr:AMP-binding protein [Alphaproteobacteria bacterium]
MAILPLIVIYTNGALNIKKFFGISFGHSQIFKVIKKDDIFIDSKHFIKTKFFNSSKLNYAENCLQKNTNEDAIIFYNEQRHSKKTSWKKLRSNVFKIAHYFKSINISQKDRIAAVLPNMPETVEAFLACAQIGAIWSSCSSDFGPKAIIDRFKQIDPKILIITDYYFYNNKKKLIP